MTDAPKVVNLFTRRPKETEDAETEFMAREAEEAVKRKLSAHQTEMVAALDQLKALIEDGRIEGLIFAARETDTGLFCTNVHASPPAVPVVNLFSYIGALETLKMELVDYATCAPQLLTSGEVVDPYANVEEFDDEEEEF